MELLILHCSKALDADGPQESGMLAFEIVLDSVPEPRGKSGKARGAADLPITSLASRWMRPDAEVRIERL